MKQGGAGRPRSEPQPTSGAGLRTALDVSDALTAMRSAAAGGSDWQFLRDVPAQLAEEIAGPQADVDQSPALLEGFPPPVARIRFVKRDELDVRAVMKCDQGVMRAVRDGMPPAGHDGEAERFVVRDGGLAIVDRDHEVIDSLEHRAGLGAVG